MRARFRTVALVRVLRGIEKRAFTVTVVDLERTRHVLRENQVPFQQMRSYLLVRPEDACGCAIFFTRDGSAWQG